MRGELGNNAISNERDNNLGEKRSKLGESRRKDRAFEVRKQEQALREDRQGRGNISGRLQDFEGVLNDGTRKPFIERLEEFRDSIQRATESVRTRATSIAGNVQVYLSRKREAQSPSDQLKYVSKGVEQSIDQVSSGFQKVIKENRQAQRSRPSLGR